MIQTTLSDAPSTHGMCFRPLIEDMTWSYSRVESFEDCPYRWFLKYIKGMKEEPRFYSSYGLFMHKIIEQFYRGKLTKEEMQTKFLFDFSKEVKGARPNENIVAKYIWAGNDYFKHFKPFEFNMVAVEKRYEFKINNIPFVGVIDFLGEKDGEFYIVDNKSRALSPRSGRKTPSTKDRELDKKLRQLYIYSAAVKKEQGKLPKSLCFNCFKTGVFIEEPFSIAAYDEAIEWAKSSIEAIKNTNDFPPNRNYFSCNFICGVSNECCYWRGV